MPRATQYRNRIVAVHTHAHIDGAVLVFADGSVVQTDAALATSRPVCAAPANMYANSVVLSCLAWAWPGFGLDLNHARFVISSSGTAPVYSALGSTGRDRDLYLFAVYADKDRAGQYAAQVYEIDMHTAALATRLKAQHVLVCARPAPCLCGCRCSCCILWSTRGTATQI
jgi:hypothetical protein